MKVKLVWRIVTLYSHVQLINGGDREYGETKKGEAEAIFTKTFQ